MEPVERVVGQLELDARAFAAPLGPGEVRTVELRYTPPRDHTGMAADAGSRLGIPGADLVGQANDARGGSVGLALTVVSTGGAQAACAVFAVDFPRRFQHDTGNSGRRVRLIRTGTAVAISAGVGAIATVIAVNGSSRDEAPRTPPTQSVQQVTVAGSAPVATAGVDSGGGGSGGGNGVDGGTGGKSGGGGDHSKITIPETAGMTAQQAKDTIAKLGLNPSIKEVPGSGPQQGTVIESQPAAGELVRPQSTVVLRVHDGKVTVPNVVGMTEASARAVLGEDSLTAAFTTQKTPDSQQFAGNPRPDLVVVRTEPAAGTLAPYGSNVTAYLGSPEAT